MTKISMLISRINAFVDQYYKEQELTYSDSEHSDPYHMRKRDECSMYILGIRDAVNLLGYEAKFSDDMYPFRHVSEIVKIDEADASTSN